METRIPPTATSAQPPSPPPAPPAGRPRPIRREQLIRLLQVLVAVQGEGYPNATELAKLCEVSRRTVFRDLETIQMAGIALEYNPARQGFHLVSGSIRLAAPIDEREALAVLLIVRVEAVGVPPGLLLAANRAVEKLIQGMTASARARLTAVAAALGPQSADDQGEHDPGHEALVGSICDALARRVTVRLSLGVEAATLGVTPYRLCRDGDGWTLVGRLDGERQPSSWPLASIGTVEATDLPARVPPRLAASRPQAAGCEADADWE